MSFEERAVRAGVAVDSGRNCLVVTAMMLVAAAVGWAAFCPERLTAGSTSLVLVAEELLMDDEPGEGMVVGLYTTSSGGTLSIACPSEQADYDRTGASA